MPYTCCVKNCRSHKYNHSHGVRFSLFSFPMNEEVRKKWIEAIKNPNNFHPTKNSRVCQLHFRQDDIVTSTKFETLSGDVIDVPLNIPRLKPDAVPSILPDSPVYYSKLKRHTQKFSPKEEQIILQVVNDDQENVFEDHKYFAAPIIVESPVDPDRVTCMQEVISKSLRIPHGSDWLKSTENGELRYFYIGKKLPVPRCSVIISPGLNIRVIFENVEIRALDSTDNILPVRISDIKQIELILNICSDFINNKFYKSDEESLKKELIKCFTQCFMPEHVRSC